MFPFRLPIWLPDYSGKPISMQQCIVAFKILAAGYLCGVFVLSFERFMPTKRMTWLYSMDEENIRKGANKQTQNRKSKKRQSHGLWGIIAERNHQAFFNKIPRKKRKFLGPTKRICPNEYAQDMEINSNSQTAKQFSQSERKDIGISSL